MAIDWGTAGGIALVKTVSKVLVGWLTHESELA